MVVSDELRSTLIGFQNFQGGHALRLLPPSPPPQNTVHYKSMSTANCTLHTHQPQLYIFPPLPKSLDLLLQHLGLLCLFKLWEMVH